MSEPHAIMAALMIVTYPDGSKTYYCFEKQDQVNRAAAEIHAHTNGASVQILTNGIILHKKGK